MLYLRVRVQSLETGLFLTGQGEWIDAAQRERRPLKMGAVEAIKLCLRLGLKNVKFTARTAKGAELTEYPFGRVPRNDELQQENRRLVAKNREMMERAEELLAEVDDALAVRKELKKQFPFKRKPIAEE
jgi:hypothetical protein